MMTLPKNIGYLQRPQIHQDYMIFLSDDDLWRYDFNHPAQRLTHSRAIFMGPKLSPNGEQMVYLSNECGPFDLYLADQYGNGHKRLTFRGATHICYWLDNNHVLYASTKKSFHRKATHLYKLNISSGEEEMLPIGFASTYIKKSGVELIGRNLGDPARWKRYRGGTAGTLWLKTSGSKDYKQILKNLKSNLTSPEIIEERIYFISDHEGIGNIYSCNLRGLGLRKHTQQKEYYVRSFSYHNGVISYQAGAQVFKHDLKEKKCHLLEVPFYGPRIQTQERTENALKNLYTFALSPKGKNIAVITRGRLSYLSPWLGGASSFNFDNQERHKNCTWLDDQNILSVVVNQQAKEELQRLRDFDAFKRLRDGSIFSSGLARRKDTSKALKYLACFGLTCPMRPGFGHEFEELAALHYSRYMEVQGYTVRRMVLQHGWPPKRGKGDVADAIA